MNKELKIEFKLLIGEDHIAIDDLLNDPERLLECYMSEENPTDSSFQGGYCISINEKKWNGKEDFYFDQFSYTLNWLTGLEKLLSKKITATDVGFWEESRATATLKGYNELEIVDTWSLDKIIAYPCIVDFEEFCKLILIESRKYEQLASLVKNRIASKKSKDPSDLKKEKQIIEAMCGDEFAHYCNKLELLIKEYF